LRFGRFLNFAQFFLAPAPRLSKRFSRAAFADGKNFLIFAIFEF
jgi:hypothetical protein